MISLLMMASIATYNCEVTVPQSVVLKDGSATARSIGLPPEMDKRKFSIIVSDGDPLQAAIDWPGNPDVTGRFPAISIGGGAYAFSAFAPGPCLFTETSCLTQVTLVDSSETTANVVVVPSAITFTDPTMKNRSPFIVIIQGVCKRSGPQT